MIELIEHQVKCSYIYHLVFVPLHDYERLRRRPGVSALPSLTKVRFPTSERSSIFGLHFLQMSLWLQARCRISRLDWNQILNKRLERLPSPPDQAFSPDENELGTRDRHPGNEYFFFTRIFTGCPLGKLDHDRDMGCLARVSNISLRRSGP